MRIFLTCLTLSTSLIVDGAELTTRQATTLENATIASTATIRKHLIAVGRTSLTRVQPAVALDTDGHLLTAFTPTIDGEPLPYLAYLDDTQRIPLETLWEDAESGLALVKISELPDGITPAPISTPDSLKNSSWLIGAAYPPTVLPGDTAQLKLGTLQSDPSANEFGFLVDFNQVTADSPLFDLTGRLCGFTTDETSNLSTLSAQSVEQLAASHDVLRPFFSEPSERTLPTLPYFIPEPVADDQPDEEEIYDDEPPTPPSNPARDALQSLAASTVNDIPVVSIYNNAGIVSTGIQGVIIDPNGLILTKASEIGATPVCQFEGQSYPAVLISTDRETDLALLSIEATDLPTVKWQTDAPAFGQLVHVPLSLKAPPFEFSTASGLLSHELPAHSANAVSIHSPEAITSLGIVPEQAATRILIGGIIPEGAADRAKLQRGDRITSIDGHEITSRNDLTQFLASKNVGDEVTVELQRNGETVTATITLDPVNFRQPMANALVQTSLAISITPPSIRRSGFPATYVHDAPLTHFQNGSPLVDSSGAVIGINIATVTHRRTLALPSKAVLSAIARMKALSTTF